MSAYAYIYPKVGADAGIEWEARWMREFRCRNVEGCGKNRSVDGWAVLDGWKDGCVEEPMKKSFKQVRRVCRLVHLLTRNIDILGPALVHSLNLSMWVHSWFTRIHSRLSFILTILKPRHDNIAESGRAEYQCHGYRALAKTTRASRRNYSQRPGISLEV